MLSASAKAWLRDTVRAQPWARALLRPVYVLAVGFWMQAKGLVVSPFAALSFWLAWHSRANAGIGARPEGRVVVMLAVADMRIDPRVEREARALAAAGFQVVVIWTDPVLTQVGVPAHVDWGQGVVFHSLPEKAGHFTQGFPGFLGRAMLDAALAHNPFAFHGHDLSTCLVAMTAARRTGAHAVCDFHEWYSENVTWHPLSRTYSAHSWWLRAAYRWLERMCFAHASAIITVCRSIADDMESQFGTCGGTRTSRLRVAVIRNIPVRAQAPTREYPPLKAQFGIAEECFVLLWQGGIGPSRMIEPVIEALAFAPSCTFIIRGPEIETYGPGYRAIAERIGAGERLVLSPPVPSRDVVVAARGADAGVWTLPDLCKNFTYALPNKIFEYMSSGLAVLVAHHPEARRLVEDEEVGLSFDPYDPHSIAASINRLVDDPALAQRLRANTATALDHLDADAEWSRLVTLYRGLPGALS